VAFEVDGMDGVPADLEHRDIIPGNDHRRDSDDHRPRRQPDQNSGASPVVIVYAVAPNPLQENLFEAPTRNTPPLRPGAPMPRPPPGEHDFRPTLGEELARIDLTVRAKRLEDLPTDRVAAVAEQIAHRRTYRPPVLRSRHRAHTTPDGSDRCLRPRTVGTRGVRGPHLC
jgi:hypothetical protein